jgi:hypothetical protein
MAGIDATLGAVEIGVAISYFLFGVFTLQAFIYFKNHSNDSSIMKTLVAIVCCLELAHCVCISHAFYIMSIKHYGKPNILTAHDPDSLIVAGLLGGFIDYMVQLFFANRLRKCFKTPSIAIFCWVLAFLRIVAIIITCAEYVMLGPSFRTFDTKWNWFLTATWIDGVIVDTTIAVSLCYYMWKNRQCSIYGHTTRMIDLVIAMSISTGLVASITAIAILICSLTLKDTFIWLAISLFEPNLFSNCFLVSLNGILLFQDVEDHDSIPFSEQSRGVNLKFLPPIAIEMSHVTQITADARSGHFLPRISEERSVDKYNLEQSEIHAF